MRLCVSLQVSSAISLLVCRIFHRRVWVGCRIPMLIVAFFRVIQTYMSQGAPPVKADDSSASLEHMGVWDKAWQDLTGPSVSETAGCHQDSGLQFVGDVPDLRQSCGFKPMYPFQVSFKLSTMAFRPTWRTKPIPGVSPDLWMFASTNGKVCSRHCC